MPSSAPEPAPLKPWYKPPTGPMVLGEAPIYRSSDSTLHWVDCLNPLPSLHILKIDPDTGVPLGEAKVIQLQESVSVQYFREGKKGYVCAYYAGIAFMDEEGKLEILKEIIPKEMRPERRFNDGGVDAKGRFWAAEIDKLAVAYGLGGPPASYGEPKGRLWRYDPDGSLHEIAAGFVCGNGVDWSPDNKTMYMNDSVGQKTYAYDFDLESGTISNRRVLVDFAGTGGEPDGLVIDTNGNIWMAVYGGNRVMNYDPSGKHIRDIVLTGKNMTCPTWGGRDFNRLFITSASGTSDEKAAGDEGGNVFSIAAPEGTHGRNKHEFAG